MISKTHFGINGKWKFQSSGDQQKSYHKIYGSKENDSEIDFEEPRTALMASQTTKKPIKRVTIIIFCRNS
jgi:hypothetical protein